MFESEEKIYILCIDTLGQEKVYTEEEKNYILKIAKLIRDWQKEHRKGNPAIEDLRCLSEVHGCLHRKQWGIIGIAHEYWAH